MKAIVAAGALAIGLVSFAALAQQEQQRFEELKQRTERRVQERIADLQGRLTCVQNAQDPEALRACFPQRAAGRAGPGGPNGSGPKPQ